MEFSDTVKDVVSQAKRYKGGVNRLLAHTGRRRQDLSHWRLKIRVPSVLIQMEFLNKSKDILKILKDEDKLNRYRLGQIQRNLKS